jgi:hypothetical protein
MKNFRWTTEYSLYILAFLLALGVRLLGLGLNPLASYEAGWALQALDLSRGEQVLSAAQPGYVALTGLIFSVAASSNFTARLVPALFGSLLALAPFFFRKYTGRFPALLLAFFLALDPGLVSVSRQAGGPAAAVALTVLALGAWVNHRRLLAGILVGLALISGPAFWHGLLVTAAGWGLAAFFEAAGWIHTGSGEFGEDGKRFISVRSLGAGILALILTVLAAGTLFFKYPAGLGGTGDSLAAYLSGWSAYLGVPALRIPAALLIYQPLALVFGVWEGLRAWLRRRPEDAASQRFSLWFLAALLLAFVLPGRQVDDLVWALVPLLALASVRLARLVLPVLKGQHLAVAAGLAALLVILLLFSWNFMLGAINPAVNPALANNLVYLVIGLIAMILIAGALVALGWSLQTAVFGTSWALLFVLGLFWFSTLWGTMGQSANPRREMWGQGPSAGQIDLLTHTMSDLSEWSTGMRTSMETVVLSDDDALRWALKDWHAVRFADALDPTAMPPAIVTLAGQEPPALAASYAGQDFVIEQAAQWSGVLPADLAQWLAFRSSPTIDITAILWARSDLFPGGVLSSSANPIP